MNSLLTNDFLLQYHLTQNEGPIGDAILELIEEGKVKREDLFIVSKLWCTFHSKDKVKAGLQDTLQAKLL